MTITLVTLLVCILNTDYIKIPASIIPILFCFVSMVGMIESDTNYMFYCNFIMFIVTLNKSIRG